MRNGMITDKYGTHRWYVNDKLHRTDGPAIIHFDGSQWWYVNGQLHRTDGPAVIYNGEKQWHINGKLHRTDGPAVVYADGSQYWYVNGQRHRTDGPAIIELCGTQELWVQWWVDGNYIEEVNEWMTQLDISYPFDEEHQALFVLTFGK